MSSQCPPKVQGAPHIAWQNWHLRCHAYYSGGANATLGWEAGFCSGLHTANSVAKQVPGAESLSLVMCEPSLTLRAQATYKNL